MANEPNWDEPINSEGDTCRSLIAELADAPSQNVLGMEVVSFSISKLNRDYLVSVIRHLMPAPGEYRPALRPDFEIEHEDEF